ncbi:MAG: hypothetical protein BWY77_01830 [bacterium ADurb.Bin431]|nr:MAG: hypothetical protein BWY77_01830 [bacterium ADurb.Bin431]
MEAEQPQAQADGHDADILDTVIGEQPLEVVLGESVEHPEQAADQSDDHQQGAPPQRGRSQPGEGAQDAVEAHLDHHPGHQGRNMARGGRMGLGQPDVEGEESGLGAESGQAEQKDQAPELRSGQCCPGELVEIERTRARPGQQPEHEKEQDDADVGRDQVDQAGASSLRPFILKGDEEKGRHRHDLPGDDEEHAVGRGRDQGHAEDEEVEKEKRATSRGSAALALKITGAVKGGQGGDEKDDEQEKGRQRVDHQGEGERRDRGRLLKEQALP